MAEQKTLLIAKLEEGVLESWLRDTYSFGVLLGTTLALNLWIEPSGWINFTIAVVWFLWIVGRANKRKISMTPNDARAWLDENYPPPPEQAR